MIIPALSIKQPWASLIAQGSKTIETRVWSTLYRGPLVICSSKEPHHLGPAGQTLCLVMLRSCRPMAAADEAVARCEIYERAVAWCFGKRWPIWPRPVRGQLGLFTVLVPDTSFPYPKDLEEVREALDWSQRNDLLRHVHGL